MYTNVLTVAAFLQRIIQSAAQDGKDVGCGYLSLLFKIIKHL